MAAFSSEATPHAVTGRPPARTWILAFDMINLSWKLAFVLHGQAVPELLETYSEERLAVIRRAEKSAERTADLLGTSNAVVHHLVTRAAPAFLDSRFVLRLCADLARDVMSDYRESSLSAPARAGLAACMPATGYRI
jgi:FAD binding domain